MVVLKWLFNALLFLWLFHAVVKPLFMGYFYGNNAPEQGNRKRPQPKPETNEMRKSKPSKYRDEDGEYVDYEEIK